MSANKAENYRILIIDDDVNLNSLLTEYLQKFGYTLVSETTAAAGRKRLRRELPDLLILDVMLPDTDGLTLCREFREEYGLPIIMLTARGEVADRVMGLELGADDYVPKPFEPRELVARIQSVIRRARDRTQGEVLACDGLRLETETRRVELNYVGGVGAFVGYLDRTKTALIKQPISISGSIASSRRTHSMLTGCSTERSSAAPRKPITSIPIIRFQPSEPSAAETVSIVWICASGSHSAPPTRLGAAMR